MDGKLASDFQPAPKSRQIFLVLEVSARQTAAHFHQQPVSEDPYENIQQGRGPSRHGDCLTSAEFEIERDIDHVDKSAANGFRLRRRRFRIDLGEYL